jgi:hypothetical protein
MSYGREHIIANSEIILLSRESRHLISKWYILCCISSVGLEVPTYKCHLVTSENSAENGIQRFHWTICISIVPLLIGVWQGHLHLNSS